MYVHVRITSHAQYALKLPFVACSFVLQQKKLTLEELSLGNESYQRLCCSNSMFCLP